MRFSLPLLALAAGAVSANRLVVRDLATIQGVLSDVASKIDALDSAVKSFSGDAGPLTSANEAILASLKDGIGKVQATSELSQTDALSITSFVQGLNSSVATAIDDVIGKKEALVSAGQGGVVFQALTDQKSGSVTLSEAITSKVPQALRGIAAQLSQGIADSLDRGIAAFKGTGGSPTGSPTTSSGPSPTATTTGSGPSPTTAKPSPSTKPSGTTPPPVFTGAAVANVPAHASALFLAIFGLLM